MHGDETSEKQWRTNDVNRGMSNRTDRRKKKVQLHVALQLSVLQLELARSKRCKPIPNSGGSASRRWHGGKDLPVRTDEVVAEKDLCCNMLW